MRASSHRTLGAFCLFDSAFKKRGLCLFCFTGYAGCVSGSVLILFPQRQLVLVEVIARLKYLAAHAQKRGLYFFCFFASLADCVSGSVAILFPQRQLLLVEVIALFNYLTAHAQKRGLYFFCSFTSLAACVSGSLPILFPQRQLLLVDVIAFLYFRQSTQCTRRA